MPSTVYNTYIKGLEDIVIAASAALTLEVTISPKPGNVHRYRDSYDTRFEHYIVSASAVIPVIIESVKRGYLLGLNVISYYNVNIGKLIYEGVRRAREWHRGGNTNLGTMTLMIPLITATSSVIVDYGLLNLNRISGILRRIVEESTEDDAIYFYKAIRLANPSYLSRLDYWGLPDVFDPLFKNKIRGRGVTLLDILKSSSLWDIVLRELRLGYANILGPYLQVYLEFNKAYDWNTASILTYLYILSNEVDSIIRRKYGLTLALKVKNYARNVLKRVLESGNLNPVFELDKLLSCLEANPGSVADFIAPIIMIGLLKGIKP